MAANLKDCVSMIPAYEAVVSDEIVADLSGIKAKWPAHVRSFHDELNRLTEC